MMKINPKIAATLLLPTILASFAFPTLAMAKNNSNKEQQKMEKKIEKQIKKENKKAEAEVKKECVRAFGHLISPGWRKKNATTTVQIDPNCKLPFGIWKKLFGHATSTATTTKPTDTTAPVISNIVSRTGTTFAVITWNTNEKASAKIYWSTSTPVSTSTANVQSLNGKNFAHFTVISGLTATTTYYAVIEATDASGNKTISSQFSFKTDGSTVIIVDQTAPVISSVAVSEVSSTTAKITWNTNEPSTSKVYFGTSSPLSLSATTTASSTSTTLKNNHSITLTNLSTSTTYYFVVESKDASHNTSTSTQFSTTTLVH